MAIEESFSIDDGLLLRAVTPRRSKPYIHRCEQSAFEAVAHAIDELAGGSFTLEALQQRTGLPFTQVAVALAFLKERGCVVPGQRKRHVAATDDVYLDAMIEWHALREKLDAVAD
jgi:hypothetical protein